MNKPVPNREQAINILRKHNCSQRVIDHCQAVAALALQIARQLKEKNYQINLPLVEVGALLHDLGRSKSHKVDHSIIGAKLAQEEGLPEEVISIIKRHVGAGITNEEAQWLGWPKDNYIPQTLEQKVVCYADKCIDSNKQIPVQVTIQQLQDEKMEEAAERVKKLHLEITNLLEK